jgi:ribosome-interacting GTPase 1
MPANLPPQCGELEKEYLAAKTLQEKIIALQKYLSAIPKHKGTQRLRRQIKTKLSKLRMEAEIQKRGKTASSFRGKFAIKKEGAAQIIILGVTSSGKSSLLTALTNAKPKILNQPMTTTMPIPGMMAVDDLQIQLVEAPALFERASEGVGWGSKVLSLARNADGLILLVDLSHNHPSDQLEMMLKELNHSSINVVTKTGRVEIERKKNGGIHIICYTPFEGTFDDIKMLLKNLKIDHAIVKIYDRATLDDVVSSVIRKTVFKPTLVVANKCENDEAEKKLKSLQQKYPELDIIGTSVVTNRNLDIIPKKIFSQLKIIRVYTKRIGQKPSKKPIVAKIGYTIEDLAKNVHSTFHKRFKYAKVWGSTKYPGERVGLNYVLEDKDVVELHI